jgi:hypothetical protein
MNHDSLYQSLQWDNPEDQVSTFWAIDKCTLAEIAEGFEDLLVYLNDPSTQMENMDDVIALGKQYNRTWWRFIDPALSIESSIDGSAHKLTIAMYECSDHIILISKDQDKWSLVKDKSDYEEIIKLLDVYIPNQRTAIPEDYSDEISVEHRDELDAAGADISQRRIEEFSASPAKRSARTGEEDIKDIEATQEFMEEIEELKDLVQFLKEKMQDTEQELQETKDLLRSELKISAQLQRQLGQIKRFLINPD